MSKKAPTQITFKLISTEKDKEVTKEYMVTRPNLEQQREGQKIYNRAFNDAIQSGAIIRAKLEDFMIQQNLWDDNKQKEFIDLQEKILTAEKRLAKGGFKLSEAKLLSIEIRKLREQMRQLMATRSEMDVNTAEGQADNQRFNYWASVCLVYNDTKKPVYKDLDDYIKSSSDEEAIKGAQSLAKLLYGLSEDFESKLPENQFLKEFDFVNDELMLVNEDGHLVDEGGRLINKEGQFVDKDGNLVDIDGNPLDEDGNYAFERKPFLDDDGKPIVKQQEEEKPPVPVGE